MNSNADVPKKTLSFSRINSDFCDMKTKVVQHVTRINIKYLTFTLDIYMSLLSIDVKTKVVQYVFVYT